MNIISRPQTITPRQTPNSIRMLGATLAAAITFVGYAGIVSGVGRIDPQLASSVSMWPLQSSLLMDQSFHLSALL